MGSLHLVADLPHGVVESESRLDADDQQVQGVGQGEEDGLFAAAAEEADDRVGEVEEDHRQHGGRQQRRVG